MARCLVCNSSYNPQLGHSPEDCRLARIDAAIGRQLQASMERNARMQSRLQRLRKILNIDDDVNEVAIAKLDLIMKDEEPTWPEA